MPDIKKVEKALDNYKKHLLAIPGVVSVGIGFKETAGKQTDEICVVVGVIKKIPKEMLESKEWIPDELDIDVRTDVQEMGLIKKLQVDQRGRWRPVPGGVSIGHPNITAGTLGSWVIKDGKQMMLSNNHVLADTNGANIGDAIIQPGTYDGGTGQDIVASLFWYKEIKFDGSPNLVDAALAEPISSGLVKDEILNIGTIDYTAEAELGLAVQKFGRTTGHTFDFIRQINVTVQVGYDQNRVGLFENQIIAGPMSAGGDSGSLIVTMESEVPDPEPPPDCPVAEKFEKLANKVLSGVDSEVRLKAYRLQDMPDPVEKAVGLLFAGSDTTTVINPIQYVIEAMGGFQI
jgi:hypothetical protein